jgi:hypothetical protein
MGASISSRIFTIERITESNTYIEHSYTPVCLDKHIKDQYINNLYKTDMSIKSIMETHYSCMSVSEDVEKFEIYKEHSLFENIPPIPDEYINKYSVYYRKKHYSSQTSRQ